MNQPRIVQQKQFESLEAFIKGQSNYWAHFYKGNKWAETRRNLAHFGRFQKAYPELEEKTTRATCEARSQPTRLPYELLFETYPLMSQFVFADDEWVSTYRKPDEYLIA